MATSLRAEDVKRLEEQASGGDLEACQGLVRALKVAGAAVRVGVLLALGRVLGAWLQSGEWSLQGQPALKRARLDATPTPPASDLIERRRSVAEAAVARVLELVAAASSSDAEQQASWVVLEGLVLGAAHRGLPASRLLTRLVAALLTGQPAPSLLKAVHRLSAHPDVRLVLLRALVAHLEQQQEGGKEKKEKKGKEGGKEKKGKGETIRASAEEQGRQAATVLLLLKACALPPEAEQAPPLVGGAGTTGAKRPREETEEVSWAAQRRYLERAWQLLVALPLPGPVEGAVLQELVPLLSSDVLSAPLLLHGWLSALVARGGPHAPLALHALFLLMTRHGLDYPAFYPQLYALLDAPALLGPERARLLRLCAHFLQSPLLPAYLVAAFLKRVARLALTAPPDALALALAFLFTVLQAHPPCHVLVHRARPVPALGALQLDLSVSLQSDPYDATSADLAEAKALDSSLWELNALMAHWAPTLAARAKLFKGKPGKRRLDVGETEQQLGSFAALWDAELARKIKKGVPLSYEKPTTALNATDFPGWALPQAQPTRREEEEEDDV